MQSRLCGDARRHASSLLSGWLRLSTSFCPVSADIDPISQMLVEQAAMGGSLQTGLDEMIDDLQREIWPQHACSGSNTSTTWVI